MLQRSPTAEREWSADEVNIDILVARIFRLGEREKFLVSIIVAGKDDSLADLMGLKKNSAVANRSVVFAKLGIPRLPTPIRLLYVKAAGLKAIGHDTESNLVLARIQDALAKL